jgi:hypothetical protein
MSALSFAKGVEFDEDKHQYWYKGGRLSGVTGLIAKKLGIKMPQKFVEEYQMEGTHVHKAVQMWIETGDPKSIHKGVAWLMSTFYTDPDGVHGLPQGVYSEVLVSDFKQYASAVDIVWRKPDGALRIYDIKNGVFKREYVTYQLSIYKYFIEKYSAYSVAECTCICIKDKEYYKIFPKPFEAVEKLLYGKPSAVYSKPSAMSGQPRNP